jgi:molybdopterin molybdotransferase
VKTLDQIAAELQGYDPQAMTAEGVLNFLSRLVTPVQDVLELPLFEALGRVLAEDVISPFDVPPHDNSAMDGYAFSGKELAPTLVASRTALPPEGAELAWGGPALRSLAPDAALDLQVVGTALAGKAWQGSVLPGQCVKIMTGAVMPAGLDTVVPQEFVQLGQSGETALITIPAGLLRTGDNRRLRGEDLMQGKAALHKGELLTPARLGLAASLGLKTLQTWRPLRVAYFSTGDEILSLGEAPREGAVYDSNRYTVFGMLSRLGCQVIDMGVVRDDPALLEAAFTEAATQADAIITSGGVSVGEADYTKAMMKKLGDVAFWKIAMRPGRPMAVGRIIKAKFASSPHEISTVSYTNNSNSEPSNDAILFGLPGNPVAVMVTFLVFVRPALLKMMGSTAAAPPLLKARSSEAIRKKPGRTEYQRGILSVDANGRQSVQITGSQGSGILRSMTEANCMVVLHHEQSSVNAGDMVDVLLFEGLI